MPSSVELIWLGLPNEFDAVTLRDGAPDSLFLMCRTLRQASFQWTRGSYDAENRGNYRNAFIADYNQLNVFDVLYLGSNSLRITHPDENYFQTSAVDIVGSEIALVAVVNTPSAAAINITNVAEAAGTIICDTVELTVTADVLATKILSPISVDPNAANPFVFEANRGTLINIRVENSDGEQAILPYQVPTKITAALANVSVLNSPSGATITASMLLQQGTILNYSLDDIAYQTSNSWANITQGSYTMYFRDQFGCKVEVPFEVEDFESGGVGVLYPVADLPPKSNSIRMSRIVDFDTTLKNDENTQSCESKFTLNPSLTYQLFKNGDLITTQFRTNYGTIAPKVIKTDGTEALLPVVKKSSNIGLTDSRDSFKYRIDENLTGIYFTSGNTYDFYTTLVNGSYVLNGGLPQWAVIGGFVSVDGAWYEILNKVFDSVKNAEVIVIGLNYTGLEETEVVGSIYNAQQYEVYEYTVDFNLYSDSFVRVRLDLTDTNVAFPDVSFQSEIIRTADSFKRTVQIDYWNDENSGNIVYSTNIRHRIHIPMSMVLGVVLEESAADRTDTSAHLIESNVHEGTEFRSARITKEMMRKLVLAYNHQNIRIDDVIYVKEGETTVEPVIGTDLYKITCVLVKGDEVYSTTPQDATEGSDIEVPNLLEDSGYFVKYKDN